MSWLRKLFGREEKHGEQEKAKIPPSVSASVATASAKKQHASAKVQQPDCIGARFDIGKIDSGGYGEECWKVFWRAVDTEIVAGSQLLEGDTNDTPDRENVYCLAVKWMAGSGRGDDVRLALEQSEHYRKVASNPNFISSIQVSREPLVEAGRVDQSGRIVGTSYHALPGLEKVQKEQQQDQVQPGVGSINSSGSPTSSASEVRAPVICKSISMAEAFKKANELGIISPNGVAAAMHLVQKPKSTIYAHGVITCVCGKSLPIEISMMPGLSGGGPPVTCQNCGTRIALMEQISDNTAVVAASIVAVKRQYQSSKISIRLTEITHEQKAHI